MKYLHLNFWISVTITFVVILLLAHLIHHFVEKPALQFLRRNKNSVNN
jgi:peptidoglycan/LPS O-acetylase OafA/YrhL